MLYLVAVNGWLRRRVYGGLLCCAADVPTSNKFRWSEDRLTMTVVDVCKYNCTSSSSSSTNDLMVIQCNASNQYGYTFVNGYLNVFGQQQYTLLVAV